MSEPSQLDRTFQIILKHMVETGQAPHYTEISSKLDVPVEQARKALHELFPPASSTCLRGRLYRSRFP